MALVLIAACIAAAVFGFRLFQIKRQLRRITSQLNDRTDEKNEKKITVALIDNDVNNLAAAVNRSLDVQEKLRIDVRRNDRKLKDSIANLSHDLRTPLTSILGYLQLSQNPECPAGKRGEYLKTVSDKSYVLKAMINSLYELSVLDITETELKKEKLDLNLLLGNVLAGQYELFRKLGIAVNVDLPDYPVWIDGDRVACTRITENLLSNSARYAKEHVGIVLTESGRRAFLSICNDAPDLKAEDVRHLFERFYTADKSRNSGGSGLGLYIVKTLLMKMGGKIAEVSLNEHILCIKAEFKLNK